MISKWVVVIILVLLAPAQALALSAQDRHSLLYQSEYYWDAEDGCSEYAQPSTQNTAPPSEIQANNAKTIIGIAKTDNLGKQGALIGLMVGLAESSLTNLPNQKVPVSETVPNKESDTPGDYDSVGVFQQRVATGWSTLAPAADQTIERSAILSQQYTNSKPQAVSQIMTPAYAAEAFFGSPPGSNAPSALSKGLQNINGWQNMDPAQAAQKVQGSAFSDGGPYAAKEQAAQQLINQYYDSASPIPLPVPVTGGSQASSGSGDNSIQSLCGGGGGSIDGCQNPFTDNGWGLSRTDQGVDFIPNQPMPVRAICDGKIISTDGSGWPGGVFILIKLASGPFAGKCTYVAEHLKDVLPVGTEVKAGQKIATALPGDPWTEWGWASAPQTPSTRYNGDPDGTAEPGGKAFARFIRQLGGTTRDDPGPGPEYAGDSCQ